jgi:lipid A 3-O-deacylase
LKRSIPLRLALLGLAMAATAPARARAESASSNAAFTEYAKGVWTVQTYGGYLNELGPHDQEGGFAAFGASYYFRDNMSLGLELVGYGISQPGPEAVAGGPQIVFRHHVVNTRDTSFFLDLTAAFAEASERVPPEGTRFNFIEQFGMGVTRDLRGNAHLLLGVRYYHLSNAGIEGGDRNPSNNGIVGYVGVLFTL